MNKWILPFLLSCIGQTDLAYAQILQPVHWSTSYRALGNNEFELTLKATMDKGWAIYSQTSDPNAAQPTEIKFETGNHLRLIGPVVEKGQKKEGPEPLFDNLIVAKYYDQVEFVQKIHLLDPTKSVRVSAYFMSCDSEKCIPPAEKMFTFDLANTGGNKGSLPADFSDDSPTSGLLEPVKVHAAFVKNSETKAAIIFELKIQDGWYVYSNKIGEGGPIPTSIDWNAGAHFKTAGTLNESSDYRLDEFDEIFEMKLTKYKKLVRFSQEIELVDPSKKVEGFFTYQTCDATKCLPPKSLEFAYDHIAGTIVLEGSDRGQGMNMPVMDGDNVIDQAIGTIIESQNNPIANCGEETTQGSNLLWTFIFGFLGGLLALLTPCVFPMIPLTVSFFTKDKKSQGLRNALLYGASIIVIYVSIGLLITALFGATALNELSTNWVANTLFFIIFIVFAFSFFGYYEIQLPSSWATKSDALAETGGILGIFFMAFTLAIVSFSCTGPIIGSAIVQSSTNRLGPFIVMLGFSSALAIPFGLFAAFPAFLNSLPRSGSWMNSVKVVLGFLELALAFKFLSVADMCEHWGILKYEVFMGIWVLIFALMTLYLFGFIRFPHDSPVKKLSAARWAFALGSFALTCYLASGFIYDAKNNSYRGLKLLSGLAPPSTYNLFLPEPDLNAEIKSKYPSFSKCANNIDCFKNYFEALEYAREKNKPILIDFTGYGCVNCRKTEEHIWVDEEIKYKLNNEFVLVSLYVDDRSPIEKELISKNTGAKIRNVGNKWADFQIINFNQNSQPLYVMLTPNQQVLAKPRGYHEGIASYNAFLECGLMAFKKTANN